MVLQLGTGELAAQLIQSYFVFLERGGAQLAQNALDVALGDGGKLLSLGRLHVALEEPPCLLATGFVGIEVQVCFDVLL